MASFTGSVNLMALSGARILNVKDENGKDEPCICIPVHKSGITISENHRDANRPFVNLPVSMWPTSEAFKNAIIRNRQSRGDDMSNFATPSHQMEVSFSKEVREMMQKGGAIYNAMKARMIAAHDANLKDGQAKWEGLDEEAAGDESKALKNAIYNSMKIQLGNFYIHLPKGQQGQQQYTQNGGYQQQAPQYGQAAVAPFDASGQYGPNENDLPF